MKKENKVCGRKTFNTQWQVYWWHGYCAENDKPVVCVEDRIYEEPNAWSCILLCLGNSIYDR